MTEIVLATTTVDEAVEAAWLQTDFSVKRYCSRAIGMDAEFHGFEIAKSEGAIALPTSACRVKDSRIGHEST